VLVEQYAQTVWDTARARKLTAAAATDVSEITWLRCLDRLDEFASTVELGSWLVATAEAEAARAAVSPGLTMLRGRRPAWAQAVS
jgi:DNA-directed RNA polymerase specialized sigma24 family protein